MSSHVGFLVSLSAFSLALALFPQFTDAGEQGSWVGEFVMPTKPAKDIQIGDWVGDKQVFFSFSGRWSIKVRGERDGWLRINDGHQEGWVDKADFVLVRDAPAYFHRRVQANPKDTWVLFMRGAGWLQRGELDNAIKDFDEYIRLNPLDVSGFISRGIAHFDKKEYDKAIKDCTEAIRLDPENTRAYNNRGNAWRAKEEYDKALADFSEAIRLDPKSALGFRNRGLFWHYSRKEYDKALSDYTEAIRLDPKYALAFNNRGNAWHAKKEYDKEIKDCSEAIHLDPKNAGTFNSRAWLLATCPDAKYRDGKKAVEAATQACELSNWKVPSYVASLAAAYAESGDFDQAIRHQKQALASPEYAKQYGDSARMRLKLYEAKQPYRDP